jgi:hypothetical protein
MGITARAAVDSPVGGVYVDYDRDKVDEMVLALLYLTICGKEEFGGVRTWKSHDWDALDRLHERGLISDPKRKAKSVVLSAEGLARARALFELHFGAPATQVASRREN